MSDDSPQGNTGAEITVAEHFHALIRAINFDGSKQRAAQEQRDLLDQIRNALDRRIEHLSEPRMGWIASSFSIERAAYESETTRILELRHRDLGTPWALKTVPASRKDDVALTARLRREAEIGLQLRHPCLIETTMLLRLEDGTPGLLQPWYPNTLSEVSPERVIETDEAEALITSILSGLEELHSKGYIHCDVSPANIFLPDGNFENAKLGDFGISLRFGEQHKDMGLAKAGSPEFTPPEQFSGSPAEPRHDLFALGKIAQRLIVKFNGPASDRLLAFARTCCADETSACRSSVQEALHILRKS